MSSSSDSGGLAGRDAGISETARDAAGADSRDRLHRVLTLWDASMLVVASVVGAGIFYTPTQVATLLPSAGLILLAWLVGAGLSLAGALANAELGAMYPRAGGDYVYLREALHPAAGFLVGWLSFFAIYAGTIAALALILGDAMARALGWGAWAELVFSSSIIIACSALNVRGVRVGAGVNNLTSGLKIVALLAFVAAAAWVGGGSFDPWLSSAAEVPANQIGAAGSIGGATSVGWKSFGAALSPVLFSYLGWNASVYVASEIRDPQRNIPRSLFLGLGLCTLLYLLVNIVYLYALSPAELIAAPDAGEAASRALFGDRGGLFVGGFVLLSVLGTLNATVLVGPRIAYAMALDGLFVGAADRVHEGFRTPDIAIWLQAGVSIALVAFLDTFPKALDFTVFGIVLATSADVVALFALRWRRPELTRPYRAWGYPWVPAIYVIANVGIGAALILASPRECLITGGLLVVGLVLYFALDAWRGRRLTGGPA
jgi:APA family basic amino acid/polyamine antiporter